METHHIDPADDTIESAIPVCFECHAEIQAYNPRHPRGRKFTPEELRQHKNQWLAICESRPGVLINSRRVRDVGPLQALVDELDFNFSIATSQNADVPARFRHVQFDRAIQEGVPSILNDNLKNALFQAYGIITRFNGAVDMRTAEGQRRTVSSNPLPSLNDEAGKAIDQARQTLIEFLKGEHIQAD